MAVIEVNDVSIDIDLIESVAGTKNFKLIMIENIAPINALAKALLKNVSNVGGQKHFLCLFKNFLLI